MITIMKNVNNFQIVEVQTKGAVYLLKLVSAICYQIFNSPAHDSPSKTVKNVFCFIEKALFVLELFNFL